ncbi:MAG: class I SAM-dependent methyltransferase [Gemmatimonadota bacterium]
MIESRPSATAQRVAMRRAAHQLLDWPPVFEDPLAVSILGAEEAEALRADPTRNDRSPASPYLRAFFAVRSRFAEDTLADLVVRGLDQYVILGAGLDTFAYRATASRLRVFEVDHPATQAWKRRRLDEAGITMPAGVALVPVNFEQQNILEELRGAGLDPARATFFSWLGVTPYLSREAVDETLRLVSSFPRSSGIVFDYGIHPDAVQGRERELYDRMAGRVASLGEPWRTFFHPGELSAQLSGLGFSIVEELAGEEINRRYFTGRNDGLRVGRLSRLMRAEV